MAFWMPPNACASGGEILEERRSYKLSTLVIVFLTGSPARGHVEGATAIGTAFGAIESLTENLAIEVEPSGVRVVCLRTTANADSRSIRETVDGIVSRANLTKEHAFGAIANLSFLKMPANVADTAKAAVLLASDRARMLTGTVVNFMARRWTDERRRRPCRNSC